MKPQEYTELTVQPCSAKEEAEAKALILPEKLQEYLSLENNCWGFVYNGKELIGTLMWGRDEKYPTEIGLALWVGETEKEPNQNLYVRKEQAKAMDQPITTEKVYGSTSIYKR